MMVHFMEVEYRERSTFEGNLSYFKQIEFEILGTRPRLGLLGPCPGPHTLGNHSSLS